jgi:hypothetical protein
VKARISLAAFALALAACGGSPTDAGRALPVRFDAVTTGGSSNARGPGRNVPSCDKLERSNAPAEVVAGHCVDPTPPPPTTPTTPPTDPVLVF